MTQTVQVLVNDNDFEAIVKHAQETDSDFATIMVDGARRTIADHAADAKAKAKAEKEAQAKAEKQAKDAEKNAQTPAEGKSQPLGA